MYLTKVTCAPSIQYFSVSTFALDDVVTLSCEHTKEEVANAPKDIPGQPPNKAHCKVVRPDPEILLKSGIFSTGHPPKTPLTCSISGHSIVVKTTLAQEPDDFCGGNNGLGAQLFIDGKFAENIYMECKQEVVQDTLYIFQNTLRHCIEHTDVIWSPYLRPPPPNFTQSKPASAPQECKQVLLEPPPKNP